MRKFSILALTVILSALALFSCSGGSGDAPEGLQVALDSECDGYIFYAPENWAIVNTTGIAAAKVSAINNTSITFTESAFPEGTIPEYFDRSLSEFPTAIAETMTVVSRDEKCLFGNAKGDAYKYVYTYEYDSYDFACMQILLTNADRFYIFTYTSYGDVSDESSNFNYYLDEVTLAIDSFKFKDVTAQREKISFGKDADGYDLVSDRKISGFDLYIPEGYDAIYSDAYVKVKITDGANLSLSKATQTGIGIFSYLELRKNDMKKFVTDFTDIKIGVATEIDTSGEAYASFPFTTLPEYDAELVFGNLEKGGIVSYEYKYTFDGEVYHVYQLMGVDSFSGYVFTYTAHEDEFAEHIDEIRTILEKVEF